MPRVPGQEPPSGEGGGAAERLRQFEQARGLRPEESDEEKAEHADDENPLPDKAAQESTADPGEGR